MSCPLCVSAEVGAELEVARVPVWRCRRCDLLFIPAALAPEPEPYDEAYFAAADFAGSAARARRLRRFTPAALRLAQLQPPGRVLDIGTGTGEFLVLMRALGWEVDGIEFSAAACRIARERNDLTLRQGDVLTQKPERPYAAITAFDFFSHLEEPRAFFDRVRDWLAPDGLLVLRTGDHRRLSPAAIVERGWGSPREHRLLLSRQTLDWLAGTLGWELLSVEYPHAWSAGAAVMAADDRLRPLVPVRVKDRVQAMLARLLPAGLGAGEALLAVLRRSA